MGAACAAQKQDDKSADQKIKVEEIKDDKNSNRELPLKIRLKNDPPSFLDQKHSQ